MIAKQMLFFVFLIFAAFPTIGFAAKKGAVKKGRVVEVHFDNELVIKGKLLGPSLFTLYQKRNVEFGKLIKPKENFLPEMRATLMDIE